MTSPTAAPVLPGPRGVPLLGSLPAMRRQGVLDFHIGMWRQYGEVAACRIGPLRSVTLTNPDHLQHILTRHPDRYVKGLSHDKLRAAIGGGILTLEGEAWRRRHSLLQPTYTPRNVALFARVMLEETAVLRERWAAKSAEAATIDLNEETTAVTMRVISRSIFGLDSGPGYREAVRALYTLLEYTARTSTSIVDLPMAVPTPLNLAVRRARRVLRAYVGGIVAQRRADGLGDDLLSMLMDARDAGTGDSLSDEDLFDEVVITVFAGHETTASLLTWAWYLLAGHPEEEEALHAELDAVLAGRTPTPGDMAHLPRTRMVLEETLRLYSPVPILARDLAEDDELGGLPLARGDMAVLLPYGTHRRPELWRRPLQFRPEHFAPDEVAARPRGAYLPFGAGRRICIGKHFAMLEATLILAEVAQRFRLRLAEPNDGAVSYIGVARPVRPIRMRVEARDT